MTSRFPPSGRTALAVAIALTLPTTARATDLPSLAAPVVVTATRLPTQANELLNDVTVIERAQIEASGASSLPELLAAQPGLQWTTNGGAGKASSLFVRGAESRHTVVLVDGLRLNSATTGEMAWQHLPLAQIERIEIVRGPVSSLYGSEAIGGVVHIFTRRTPGRSVQASVGSRSSADLAASVAARQGQLDYALTLGHSRTAGTSAIVNPANAAWHADADGYRQENLSGRLGWQLAPGHALAATLFYSDGVTRYDAWGAGNFDARMLHTLQAFGLTSDNRLSEHWFSRLRVGHSSDDSTNHASATSKSVFRTEQTQWVWQNDFSTTLGEFLAGLERLEQRITSTTAYAQTRRTVDSWLLGYQGRLDAHRLHVSLRRDDNSQFGAKTTGMAYYGLQLDRQWRVSLGAGTSFSAPTFNQLYFPGYGNPDLRPERGRNREATLIWAQGPSQLSATWFDNRVSDLIQSVLVAPPFGYMAQNVQQARLTGWTLTAQTAWDGWQIDASADWLDARDRQTGLRLPRRARETLKLSLARAAGPWTWRTELMASGARFDDAANRRRLGGYATLNLGLDYRHSPELTFFARANNLFDKRYELAADFATPRAALFVGLRHNMR